MNLIGLLDHPDSGSISIDGQESGSLSPAEAAQSRRQILGFVFQNFHLLPRLTAWENVALPLVYSGVRKAERRTRALAMLDRMGMANRADHKPGQMSGGQCQRVAIGRALIGSPKIILADEPTGCLDSSTADDVMGVLFEINKSFGATVVIVTHDPRISSKCSRSIEIRDGQVFDE
jgi:putative ABC transport system ATP-binding protein